MLKSYLKSKSRWFPFGLLLVISCAAAARTPQEAAFQGRQTWPKEIETRDSKIVVYEPQLETFKGSRMTSRSAISVIRADASEPVFGGIWLDATLNIDADRKTATPLYVKVTDIRFPNMGTNEAARLRQDIGDEIPRWNLVYSVDALLAELKLLEEQKASAEGLKADVPQILFRTSPAVLLSIEGDPTWRPTADSSYRRLENSGFFVLQDSRSGICYLHIPSFWWTATNPLGPWQDAADVPDAVDALWNREPKPQVAPSDAGQDAAQRPELIPVNRPTELVWTDGPVQYAAITGTDLLYIKNTESDVFLDIQTQVTYALFSGRWYRASLGKTAWEFIASDQLPTDFSRIPLSSEKRHVLACVAGTAQARDAVQSAEIPQTEAVKPGLAPDLSATFDGEPQFTNVPDTTLQYAVNTPYSIFCADRRYYWCLDGIWYDSDYAIGPWYVCTWVPRLIYLIPPSCPHYYVTYCHVFSVTPNAVYVGYYPGYRGCYVWGRTVVYGTGWNYRPWCGNQWYSRPVTWGVCVRYSPMTSSWSIRLGGGGASAWGIRRPSSVRAPLVQAGAGGWWGGTTFRSTGAQSHATVNAAAPVILNSRQNLYARQPERLAPSPVRAAQAAQPSSPDHEFRNPRGNAPTLPPAVRHETPRTTAPSVEHETPRTAPPVRAPRDVPSAPPPTTDHEAPRTPSRIREPREVPSSPPPTVEREAPKPPPPQNNREVPRTPPPQREFRDVPRTPPPQQNHEAPRTPPPAPREQREAPRTPPPPPPAPAPQREAPKDPPRSSERRRSTPPPSAHEVSKSGSAKAK
jgi:hypothetical protein